MFLVGLYAVAAEFLGEYGITNPALIGDDVVQDIGVGVVGDEGDVLPFAGETAGHLNSIVKTSGCADALVKVLNTLRQPRGEGGVLHTFIVRVSAVGFDPEADAVGGVLLDGEFGNLETAVPGVACRGTIVGPKSEFSGVDILR